MSSVGTGQPRRGGGRASSLSTNEAAIRRRRRGSVPGDVADHLRHQILTGQLKPGERIDQQEVAVELDVSRSPIREAVVLLSQEGLLDLVPNRGAQVADLRASDIADHYRLLAEVVGGAAALAADQLDDRSRASLHELIERGANVDRADRAQHDLLHAEFQRAVVAAAPRRTRWLAGLLAQSMPLDVATPNEQWNRGSHELRAAVVDAIERRDADAARAAAERYFHAAGEHLVAALGQRGVWDKDLTDEQDARQPGRQTGEGHP